MRTRAAVLLAALVLLGGPAPPRARPAAAAPSNLPGAPGAVLELTGTVHALEGRTLVISGWARNVGRLPVSRLVIDASGFAPAGDLAAFGSDGIPWTIAPNGAERFRVFLPLGSGLVSNYIVTVSASQPPQVRPASVIGFIFPAFYRSVILARVRVDVDDHPLAVTFRASADRLPVTSVLILAHLLVREKKDVILQTLTLEVPVDRPLRLRFPLLIRVIAVNVVDVVLASTWASP